MFLACRTVVFRDLYGLNFGLSAAPAQFCRVSLFLQSVFRRIFCIITSAYVDDFFSVDPITTAPEAQMILHAVFDLLGIKLKTAKAIPPAVTNIVLGIEVDLSQALAGIVVFKPTPKRLESIVQHLRHAAETTTLQPAWTRRFAGKLEFLISATDAALVRFHLRAFYEFSNGADTRPTRSIQIAARMLLHDIPSIPPRVFCLPRHQDPSHVIIYVDARHDDRDVGVGALMFVGDAAYALSADVPPPWVLTMMLSVSAIINQAELLAIHTAIRTMRHVVDFAGRDVVVYTDSTSALSAAIKGSSNKSPHLANMGHRYRRFVWHLRLRRLFHEYIPSAINPADPLSRIAGGITRDCLPLLDSADLLRWCTVAGYKPAILAADFPPVP